MCIAYYTSIQYSRLGVGAYFVACHARRRAHCEAVEALILAIQSRTRLCSSMLNSLEHCISMSALASDLVRMNTGRVALLALRAVVARVRVGSLSSCFRRHARCAPSSMKYGSPQRFGERTTMPGTDVHAVAMRRGSLNDLPQTRPSVWLVSALWLNASSEDRIIRWQTRSNGTVCASAARLARCSAIANM